jgi:hypothetical protein
MHMTPKMARATATIASNQFMPNNFRRNEFMKLARF